VKNLPKNLELPQLVMKGICILEGELWDMGRGKLGFGCPQKLSNILPLEHIITNSVILLEFFKPMEFVT
jgi:hypothetical protein